MHDILYNTATLQLSDCLEIRQGDLREDVRGGDFAPWGRSFESRCGCCHGRGGSKSDEEISTEATEIIVYASGGGDRSREQPAKETERDRSSRRQKKGSEEEISTEATEFVGFTSGRGDWSHGATGKGDGGRSYDVVTELGRPAKTEVRWRLEIWREKETPAA
ncbi:hypothetical protein TIFTF001_039214 [Ficus carica]|uniref:Uncharacterized protein n=1 Tax=Ficus carica TaxID=3494 RepID=A0AA88EJF3_FICCA|nr:hypothetical protein TIFTF001_039214 [Ficus carica]